MSTTDSTSTPTIREFLWCGTTLSDPDLGLTAIQVRDLYSSSFPELTNAAIKEAVVKNGVRVIEFTKKVGTKG